MSRKFKYQCMVLITALLCIGSLFGQRVDPVPQQADTTKVEWSDVIILPSPTAYTITTSLPRTYDPSVKGAMIDLHYTLQSQEPEPPCVFARTKITYLRESDFKLTKPKFVVDTAFYRKIAGISEWTTPALALAAGFMAGAGEGTLAKDGNWDTRSFRSHFYRDVSTWLDAGTGFSFAINIGADYVAGDMTFGKFLWRMAYTSGVRYLGTRVGYKLFTMDLE